MEIKKLEIDIEAGTLKINGKDYKEKPIVVTLPGSENWPLARLFNSEQITKTTEEYDSLFVSYTESNNMP